MKVSALVGTPVPIDMFDYAAAAKIKAKEKIVMNLATSPSAGGYELVADVGTDLNNNEEAAYKLEVNLQQQFASEEDPISPAVSVVSKGVGMIILVSALANTLWIVVHKYILF